MDPQPVPRESIDMFLYMATLKSTYFLIKGIKFYQIIA
jgi:hypothetical protein